MKDLHLTASENPSKTSEIIHSLKSHRRLIRNIVIGAVGLSICGAVAYLIFLVAVASAIGSLFQNSCDPSSPAAVEGMGQFKLPPSASHLQSNCGGMQGFWAEASFEMNPADLRTFVKTTRVKLPLSSTGKPVKLNCEHYCNALTDVKSYLYGTYSGSEWDEEIFIDTTNPNSYAVYYTALGG